ncbi:CDP-diacylglycerol--glycerol-3-phosphate 3-phosphatidyltransferase [Paenibacillus agilis]|uniref:Phosphatidylglycerophosphate synthase n=1 Tax=Paenibacillus agilis TaxID=3020863 RepID=A0A559IPJ6_9BACL|nr:CDP-diacylglycerol--glycerol-3-phosphate 3-phosphatidyltransferase [Paenibacillus agilis]
MGVTGGFGVNVPNFLTAIRFVLIPVYLMLFFVGERYIAFVVWLFAGLTDVLDGYLARKRNEITFVGKMLDPLADKLMILAVMFSLLWSKDMPILAVAAMLVRDGGMILGSLWFYLRGKKTLAANTMGKLTTVLLYAAIVMIYFQWQYAVTVLWIVIGFSYLTSLLYSIQIIRVNGQTKDTIH